VAERAGGPPTPDPAHAGHDRTLVAALAADDLATEGDAATALVASCTECAALHADLVAIATATRALPAPVRSRDFRLTPEDAARLDSNPWRRLGDWFRRPAGLTRPLAVTFTTLGLAGLLVSSLPAVMPFGSSAAGPLAPAGQSAPASAAAPAPPPAAAATAGQQPVPAASSASSTTDVSSEGYVSPSPSEGEAQALRAADAAIRQAARTDTTSALFIGSLLLFLVGIAMLGLVVLAGRRPPT
jgi:hypothetical protein